MTGGFRLGGDFWESLGRPPAQSKMIFRGTSDFQGPCPAGFGSLQGWSSINVRTEGGTWGEAGSVPHGDCSPCWPHLVFLSTYAGWEWGREREGLKLGLMVRVQACRLYAAEAVVACFALCACWTELMLSMSFLLLLKDLLSGAG